MDRRQALLLLGKGMCGALAVGGVAGCTNQGASATTTEVALDAVPDGGRLEVDHLGNPVELSRSGTTVEARSLWCTHFGCVVQWDGARQEYLCPCHDGRFDARGRPIDGPPTAPLRVIPVSLVGDTLEIGGA